MLNELAHHGIKGQRWGVRRYQNKDGSYTEEGRQHYGITEKAQESGTKFHLSESTKRKIAKTLAITAGVAVTAAAAYYIGKNVGDTKFFRFTKQIKTIPKSLLNTPLSEIDDTDVFLDAGSKLKRVSQSPKFEKSNFDYMSFLDSDANRYKQFLYKNNNFEQTLQATKTIKAMSGRKQIKVFEDLIKNKEFLDSVNFFNNIDGDSIRAELSKSKSPEQFEKTAKAFYPLFMNTLGQGESNKAVKMYTDTIRKLGYNAMVDMNDSMLGIADRPIISLSSNETIVQTGSKKITQMMLYFGALKL